MSRSIRREVLKESMYPLRLQCSTDDDHLFGVVQIRYIGFSGLPLDAFTYILDR